MNRHSKIMRGVTSMHTRLGAALLVMGIMTAGCDLDLVNPNSPTEATVLTDDDGILGLTVGIQEQFAGAARHYALPSALVTDEWGPRSRALPADKAMFEGTPDPEFGIVANPFAQTFQIMRTADNIVQNAPNVGLGPALLSGVLATAKLHKAMAMGRAIQIYEEYPVALALEGAPPASRDAVLDTVLSLLESARSDLADVSDADLAGFRQRVLDPGIDLRSSIDAVLARYYLIDGQYDAALEAANRADDENASYYTFSGTEMNTIYQYSSPEQLDYTWPLLSFAREAEAGDQRVAMWTDTLNLDETVDPVLAAPVAFMERDSPYPLYRPDEMRLIRAEVHARNGNLLAAIDEINEVRTQCDAGIEDPAPCLPALTLVDLPTAEDVLAQIAYERRYELYEQGLRWEDMRRLGQYIDEAPTYDFFPIPRQECITNANACP